MCLFKFIHCRDGGCDQVVMVMDSWPGSFVSNYTRTRILSPQLGAGNVDGQFYLNVMFNWIPPPQNR